MLNKNEILQIATTQLSLDYNFNINDLTSKNNIIVENTLLDGRRIYDNDGCFLKILCFNGKAFISADPKILPWCKEKLLTTDAAWLSEYPKLKAIDNKLKEFGHEIADIHHYYLPKITHTDIKSQFSIKWYEKDDIYQFEDDNRFGEAFAFDKNHPDVLAVAAFDGDIMLGMAGASADSDTMWQIGIDVFPEYRGKGIATTLVTLLKNEVLNRGKVPFYGTVETHFNSQNVAINSGFFPAWAELYTKIL